MASLHLALFFVTAALGGGDGAVVFMPGGAAGTDPATWTNLTVLVDSDVGVTVAAGGISNWSNAGTAADFTQGTEAQRPQSTARGVEPDGVNDSLASGALNTVVSASAYTVVAVVNPWEVSTDVSPAGSYWANDPAIADSTGGFWGLLFRSSGFVGMYHYDAGVKVAEAAISITDADAVVAGYFDGSEIGVRVNDGAWVTVSAGTIDTVTNTTRLFGNSVYSGVAVKDLVVTSDAKSQSDIEDVVTFLNAKRSVF